MEKKLYPLKFIPVAFPQEAVSVPVIENWHLADMGIVDSAVENGWLSGNTIGDLMETYLERLVGENVYNFYGRQFPLLIKMVEVKGKLSAQVHPDDQVAAERYDSLGKAKLWYVTEAGDNAKIYCGFKRPLSALELYNKCIDGTIYDELNVINPRKGDVLYITPGTVHAAEGMIRIAEVQESSDLTFYLCDPEYDHLAEAIDFIDYGTFDMGLYRKGSAWGEDASCCPCHAGECDHEHDHGSVETLVESPHFNVAKLNLSDPLHIYTEKFESFIVYICLEGAASIQVPSVKENGESYMETYEFSKGEIILIPAELPDFYLVPRDRSTVLLEAVTRPEEALDEYIDPTTEAFLEDEDYEGLEDGAFDDDDDEGFSAPSGASPLNFFS